MKWRQIFIVLVGSCTFLVIAGGCASESGGGGASDADPSTDAFTDTSTDAGGREDSAQGGECTDASYETDCPTRPCRVAVGCSDRGDCEYASLRCGGEVCECAGDECTDEELRPCGDNACGGQFCDPSPEMSGGERVFGNVCIDPPEGEACGTCELGATSCRDGAMVCDDRIERAPPRGEVDQLECDSSSASSSFLYVDTGYDGSDSDGSREAPYTDLREAIDEADQSTAVGIVVGGSPTVEGRLEVAEGVSIYGGFANFPSFEATDGLRPTIEAGIDSAENEVVVGAVATDIESRTVLSGLEIRTTGAGGERDHSSYGLYADNASGLELEDVRIVAGPAGRGGSGDRGGEGRDGGDGGPGVNGNHAPTPGASIPGGYPGQRGAGDGCRFSTETDVGSGGMGGATSADSSNSGSESDGGETEGGDESDGDHGSCCAGDRAPLGADGESASLEVPADGMPAVAGGRGEDGEPGRPGAGGGGGASGAGVQVGGSYYYGGAGGGGGAGGCGGEGGGGAARRRTRG